MKIKTLLLCAGLVLGISSSAQAYMIGAVDVGDADTLLGQTNDLDALGTCDSGGSTTAELCWINNVLAGLTPSEGPTTYVESDKVASQMYQEVDGSSSVIAFMLSSPTEYFLIKNATWHGLFKNTPNLDWAVFDTSLLAVGFNLPNDDFDISHVAPVGGSVVVPEPGTIALFLTGLTGLVISRRRKAQA